MDDASSASHAATDPASGEPAGGPPPPTSVAVEPPAVPGDPPPAGADAAAAPAAADAAATPAAAGRGLRRFRARWLALLAATGIALYVCWLMLLPFVQVLMWATVLAIVFYPAHVRLVRRTGRPGWAALLSCLLVVGTIVVPLGLVTLAVVNEARDTADYVQRHADDLLARDTPFIRFVNRWVVDLDRVPIPVAAPVTSDVQGPPAPGSPTTRPVVAMREWLAGQLRTMGTTMGTTIAGGAVTGVTFALGTLLEIVLVVFTLYYLFRDGDRIKVVMFDSLPLEPGQVQRIFDRTREVIGASVYGVFVVATIQAVLGEIGFLVVRLPSPLLWGVVLFFFSMIPIGSFLVWVPACIYLLAIGRWPTALLLAAWCLGIVGMVDNVLRPRLVGKVGSSRVDLQACKLEYSIVSPK